MLCTRLILFPAFVFLHIQGVPSQTENTPHPGHLNGAKDPVLIEYPNAIIESAGPNGHIYLESGRNGSIVIQTNDSNSVYFDRNDLHLLIQEVNSGPPVWKEHSPFGFLGRFRGGQIVSIQLHAVDPEGAPVSYKLIAGDFPPGISLNSSSGRIHGLIPDATALFKFTIRATDNHGKFADLLFKMAVQETNNCESSPCQHEGVCTDTIDDFHCACVHPHGGKTCNINCRNNYLGVDANKRYISDAQITGFVSLSGYPPILW